MHNRMYIHNLMYIHVKGNSLFCLACLYGRERESPFIFLGKAAQTRGRRKNKKAAISESRHLVDKDKKRHGTLRKVRRLQQGPLVEVSTCLYYSM